MGPSVAGLEFFVGLHPSTPMFQTCVSTHRSVSSLFADVWGYLDIVPQKLYLQVSSRLP